MNWKLSRVVICAFSMATLLIFFQNCSLPKAKSSDGTLGGAGTDGMVYASYGLCVNGQTGVSSVVKVAPGSSNALLVRQNCAELTNPQGINFDNLNFAANDRSVFTLNGQVFDQQLNQPAQKVTLEFCQSSGASPSVQTLVWQLSGDATSIYGSVTQSNDVGSGQLNVVPPSLAAPLDFVTVVGQASQFDLALTSQAGGSLLYMINGGAQISVPSMSCLTQPVPSPYPNATNTGVPTGTVLTNSGDINVTVDGTVIDSMLITGCVNVNANNVVIKNSKILGGTCTQPISVGSTDSGLTVQDTEIDGQKSATCSEAVGSQGYTLLRVHIHGCSDGPRLAGGYSITIQDSYIHDLTPNASGDGMQAYGLNLAPGNLVQILHNTIEGGLASAMFIADNALGDLVIDSNLLMGPNFPLRLLDMHAWVRNNLIYDNSGNEYSGYNGPVETFFGNGSDPGVTIMDWTNNHSTSKRDGSVVGVILGY